MINLKKDLILPDSLRSELKKPFGRVLECSEIARELVGNNARIIAVGDSVSISLIKYGVMPSLIVWDGKTKRLPVDAETRSVLEDYAPAVRVSNPPATLKRDAWRTVTDSLSMDRASIFVDGEEDLLAIPAIINSTDGSYVVYGFPNGDGAILIVIDRKIRALFQEILKRFE